MRSLIGKQLEFLPFSVKIKLNGDSLPDKVTIFGFHFKVSPSIRKSRQCIKHLRFGHSAASCRSSSRCNFYPENHLSIDCSLGDEHSTANEKPTLKFAVVVNAIKMPKFSVNLKQKNILKIMANDNMSYKTASYILRGNYQAPAFSFAEAVGIRKPVNSLRSLATNNFRMKVF